jgi:hypothetical protein
MPRSTAHRRQHLVFQQSLRHRGLGFGDAAHRPGQRNLVQPQRGQVLEAGDAVLGVPAMANRSMNASVSTPAWRESPRVWARMS